MAHHRLLDALILTGSARVCREGAAARAGTTGFTPGMAIRSAATSWLRNAGNWRSIQALSTGSVTDKLAFSKWRMSSR